MGGELPGGIELEVRWWAGSGRVEVDQNVAGEWVGFAVGCWDYESDRVIWSRHEGCSPTRIAGAVTDMIRIEAQS
jgi:hypothetical protein